MSKYTIMHKDIAVSDVTISDVSGAMTSIDGIINEQHLPVGIKYTVRNQTDYSRLIEWWRGRSIPASRLGIDEVIKTLDIENTQVLLTKNMGLSLSDHYWIKPYGSELKYSEVNFYQNGFSEDLGDLLLGISNTTTVDKSINLLTPNNSSDGFLPKKWKITNGTRCLIKGGDLPVYQQPINEIIASSIMERLNIPHVDYKLIWYRDKPYCICEDMVDMQSELVSGENIRNIRRKENDENDYLHYVNICTDLGIADIQHNLDMMIVLDFLITNEDRHFNNFGLLRNPDTLEWIGIAPIYDSGNSLRYKSLTESFTKDGIVCKPFKATHNEQLELVTSFDWYEPSNLNGIEDEIRELLNNDKVSEYISPMRASAICDWLSKKIGYLERTALSKEKTQKFITSKPKFDYADN